MQPLPCQPGPLGAPGRRRRPPPTRAARRRARPRVRPRRGNTRLGRGHLGTPLAPRRPSPETQTSTGGSWLLALDLPQAEVSGPHLYRYAVNSPTNFVDPSGLKVYLIQGGTGEPTGNSPLGTLAAEIRADLAGVLDPQEVIELATPSSGTPLAFEISTGIDVFNSCRDREPVAIVGYSLGGTAALTAARTVEALSAAHLLAGRGLTKPIDLLFTIDPVEVITGIIDNVRFRAGSHRAGPKREPYILPTSVEKGYNFYQENFRPAGREVIGADNWRNTQSNIGHGNIPEVQTYRNIIRTFIRELHESQP